MRSRVPPLVGTLDVELGGQPPDDREPQPEPRAVGVRAHPAAVVAHDDHEPVGLGAGDHPHRPGAVVAVGVQDGVGDRLADRQRHVGRDADAVQLGEGDHGAAHAGHRGRRRLRAQLEPLDLLGRRRLLHGSAHRHLRLVAAGAVVVGARPTPTSCSASIARSSTTSPTWNSRSGALHGRDHLARDRPARRGSAAEQPLLAEALAPGRRVGDAVGVEEQRVAGRELDLASPPSARARHAQQQPGRPDGRRRVAGVAPGRAAGGRRCVRRMRAPEALGSTCAHATVSSEISGRCDEDVVEQAHDRGRASGRSARRWPACSAPARSAPRPARPCR